ncbi:Serpin domain-containing protein [Caenorhabditis elegans]|uniref:Serpin domain-containing protein n=1 Tax=Caenorhabditis elegans TaxID=6239 RepID=O62309_CAEEL|nr:Serpin domain-containing protein [Caenorhabditis elegans]CAB04611.2 Serpin domain-containing protein [Caenorhabditis elegans]|eukprot:NP_493067.2 Uncharacterized protein CELE_M01G12.2 [Caenorhabditis elegans]
MKVNPSPPVWNFAISEFKKKNFKLSNGKLKKMNFIWINLETNMELSCEKTGAQMAQDKEFKVLSIPLAGDAGKFVVFFPENQEETIEESLKKLNTRKFQRLIDDLVPKFIHFELPVFKIQSKFFISENLTMTDRGLTHEKEFEVCHGENNDFRRGLLMDRCEYVPYIFRVNRPFIFCVVQNGVPVTMGIFDGN